MRPVLLAGLAATLLASATLALWPADPPVDDLLPPMRPGDSGRRTSVAPPPSATAAASGAAPGLPTRPADWPAPTALALAAWQGAAPPAPAAAPAATARAAAASAAAPVFPWRWIGQLDDGAAPQVLLASAQRTVGVRLGATLDGRWRLLRSPSGALLAQPLPDGDPLPVPGAPPAPPP